jgi:hypothetical protein
MSRHIFALMLKMFLVATALVFLAAASDMTTIFQKTGRVDESSLAQAVASPRIYAFDLSPSGRTVALLVRSGDLANAPTWLLMVDAKAGQILHKSQTSESTRYQALAGYFPPQVFFTPDEKLLVVQDQGQVRIVDVSTLRTVRTVEARETDPKVPISVCGSGKTNLFAISFGMGQRLGSELQRIPVHVEIVDVSDGARRGSWDADDIPQSLSPDGKLAAVSDWNMGGGALLKLDIFDTSSGKKLALLDGGFKFEKQEGGRTMGKVVGRFLSDDEILLSPDAVADRSGHHSGDSLRIAHIPDGKILRELRPEHFGPTGDVAISDDGGAIVAASWYLKPSFFTHPHEPMPAGSAPDLLVFSDKQQFSLNAIIKSSGGGSRVGGSLLRFRVASDGSVIAVAENFGITIFGRTSQ